MTPISCCVSVLRCFVLCFGSYCASPGLSRIEPYFTGLYHQWHLIIIPSRLLECIQNLGLPQGLPILYRKLRIPAFTSTLSLARTLYSSYHLFLKSIQAGAVSLRRFPGKTFMGGLAFRVSHDGVRELRRKTYFITISYSPLTGSNSTLTYHWCVLYCPMIASFLYIPRV